MKFFTLLGILVVGVSGHTHRDSTAQPEIIDISDDNHIFSNETSDDGLSQTSTEASIESNSTLEPKVFCAKLHVHSVIAAVGNQVNFRCICHFNVDVHDDPRLICPVWGGIESDVMHSHNQKVSEGKCESTLRLPSITTKSAGRYTCTDVNSDRREYAWLEVEKSQYESECYEDEDCEGSLQCSFPHSQCTCPFHAPIYIRGASGGSCNAKRQLFHSCSYTVQCMAAVENSYCYDSGDMNTTGICMCSHGFEAMDGSCAKRVTLIEYVFYTPRRYRILGYVVFGLGLLLIVLGLFRIYLIKKRTKSRECLIPNEVVPSSDTQKPNKDGSIYTSNA